MSRAGKQTILVLVGLAAGALVGAWLHGAGGPGPLWSALGELIILRPLTAIAIPLIFVSVALGVCGVGDPKLLGRLGVTTLAFYVGTMLIATSLGATMVAVAKPGENLPADAVAAIRSEGSVQFASDAERRGRIESAQELGVGGAWLSIARQAIPRNVLDDAARGNTLSVIVVAIVFGAALGLVGARGKPAVALLEAISAALHRIVEWILWLLPIGVFFLVAASIGRTGIEALIGPLAGYVAVVLVGLAIQGFVVLPSVQYLVGAGNGWRMGWNLRRVFLTAFATSSSTATLPVTLEECVRAGGSSERATSFVVPLGATVNMNGTALYEAVAVVFLFQLYGTHLTATDLAIVVLSATLAAIGAAGIPSAGLVTMVIVIGAANAAVMRRGLEPLPLSAIGIIIGVDRLLDMCRTVLNVWGDCVAARVVTRFVPDEGPREASVG